MKEYGKPKLILLSGYIEVDIPALVSQLLKPLLAPDTDFVESKFDLSNVDTPYAALTQIVQSVIRKILGKRKQELNSWRGAILKAVGPNGHLINDLAPDLERLIGEQPPLQELKPRDTLKRFTSTIHNFLKVTFTPDHPFVLLLVDLQWIDTPTLDLLEHLLTDPDINHILIIGTISENEVTPSHPLMKSLDSMRNSGTTIQTIVNSPSGEDHRFELNKESPRREEKPLQQFDAAKLVKTIQKVSQQLELPKLMQALTTYALETSTADRGLLIVSHDKINTVEVEASADGNNINVKAVQAPIDSNSCSETIVTYAIQARQQVILNDTSLPGVFSNDLYLQQKSKRSLLCLPLLSPNNPAGVLYLENTQSIGAFTPDRVALLELLAAQAAISLENASLYNDLKESEARYRQIIDTANEGVWIQDDNYVTTYANEHMAQMLGYTADDLIGQKATDFMFEEDKIEHALKMSERRNNKSDVYERRLIHKDGRSVWMLISATPIFKDGQFNGSVAMLTDITERIEVEQHLATSEQLFRTLIENSPDQISRYDLNLRRLYINPALQKLFKVPLDQALNKTSMVSSPLLDPEAYMAVIHKVIETEQECSDEIAFHNQQGEIEWASARFVPEFDLNGKVATVLVISNVITEKNMPSSNDKNTLTFSRAWTGSTGYCKQREISIKL